MYLSRRTQIQTSSHYPRSNDDKEYIGDDDEVKTLVKLMGLMVVVKAVMVVMVVMAVSWS